MYYCCLNELTQKTKKKLNFFKFAGTKWGGGWVCYTASLYYFRPVAHQENSQAYLSMFIIFSHSWHMTANTDVMKLCGGKRLMSILSTSKDIWSSGMAHSHLEREKKMGHCLSAASPTAYSHNNWSAFMDTLILIRPNPLFSPQWIHR